MKIFAKMMSMDEKTWLRHANPYSVWTRIITVLPLILFSIWLIKPMGTYSLFFIVPVALWTWLNPRMFKKPSRTNNWASKVTFGERIWLNRGENPIPNHHANWAIFLSSIAGVGFVIALIGTYQHLYLPAITGAVISWLGKMWFCDRMVWLFEDMRRENDSFDKWIKN